MNGLDLFSGIGGISSALGGIVNTVAYCEQDRHAQAILLSRMGDGSIDKAPIWDDVRTLQGSMLDMPIDIITAGFPCQDISCAGPSGKGLDGNRSGLFFEVCRLVGEIKPSFLFLENVPALRTKGLSRVINELTNLRYDCRWTRLSAFEVGAHHIRQRWFLLGKQMADTEGKRSQSLRLPIGKTEGSALIGCKGGDDTAAHLGKDYLESEPDLARMVDGVSFRTYRVKRLGNAVVPRQARAAFLKLLGESFTSLD